MHLDIVTIYLNYLENCPNVISLLWTFKVSVHSSMSSLHRLVFMKGRPRMMGASLSSGMSRITKSTGKVKSAIITSTSSAIPYASFLEWSANFRLVFISLMFLIIQLLSLIYFHYNQLHKVLHLLLIKNWIFKRKYVIHEDARKIQLKLILIKTT